MLQSSMVFIGKNIFASSAYKLTDALIRINHNLRTAIDAGMLTAFKFDLSTAH